MPKELFISSSAHETKVAVLEDDQLVEVYYERDTHTGLVGGIYKGRVSRVLPGMQSAFVDIGLDRDAFLYVSDFFEDAEEYDKIVADAEARVTRLAEGAPVGSLASPASVAEISPTQAAEEIPAVAPAVFPVSPRPMVESLAQQPPAVNSGPTVLSPPPAVTSPESPSQTSSGSRSFERPAGPPSDFPRNETRGRRRKRHGRNFGDRKFGPKPEFRDRPAERPPVVPGTPVAHDVTASTTFEVLPGETLAKHRLGTTESSSRATPPSASAEPRTEGLDEPPSETLSVEARHEVWGSNSGEANASFGSSSFPTSTSAESGSEFSAASEPASPKLSEPASPAGGEPAPALETHAAPFRDREDAVVATTEIPTRTEPISELKPEPKPRPLWDRLVSTVLGKSHESFDAHETKSPEAAASSDFAPGRTPYDFEPTEATETTLEPEAVPISTEPPPLEAGLVFAPEGVEQNNPANSGAQTAEGIPSLTAPVEPATREYTMRESNQRPRFAPRRRGRQGRGTRDIAPATGPSARREAPRAGNNQPMQIAELLKEGQEILVQIAKEPLGRKGARITSHIALPGRYLVYMPTVDHMGVSRKIASEEERLRLKNIMLDNKGVIPGGFIVRTAGAGRPEEELRADMKFLSTLWSDIRTKSERTKAPALLHRDLDLMQRILRDILSPDFKTVRVDSEIEFERALEFVNQCQPSLVGHVKLYTREKPLFEECGIQAEIDKALKSKVWLQSGGYIVINQTEALVAIDVNTGKYVGKTNRLEDTIVKTNIDAVKEIVRQIRLRDLGGIIVIDFIDMDERRNRNKVVQALEEALRFDRAPTKILSFNDFGLVALTRKRVKQSLERTLCEPCAYCTGSGWIKSVTTICYEILAEARKMAADHEGGSVTLRVHPEVAKALKSREGVVLSELEALTHKDVIVKSDASVHQERFEIY